MAKPEFLMTLPKRGLQIIPPPETQRNMALAGKYLMERSNELPRGKIVWSAQEKGRIRLIKKHGPLKKRFPNPEAGREFMACVDYEQREKLLVWAKELSDHIVAEWVGINPECPIAVVLYGSVARGTVKPPDYPNPSDIDLFVTGDFSVSHRHILFAAIQRKREDISERIAEYTDICLAGVKIQPTHSLCADGYNAALNYIGSPAISLFDPFNLWSAIEQAALGFFIRKERGDPVMFNGFVYQKSPERLRTCRISEHYPCG